MATLVHDDLIDGAGVRRGRAAAWTAHGEDAARAAGDYLFARAFAELAGRATRPQSPFWPTRRSRSRAARRCSGASATTRTRPVDGVPRALRAEDGQAVRGRLPARRRQRRVGLLLGVAFQIADDILDCTGDTIETGKVPGTDLRDGTPTLPLLLAAQDDPVVRAALAGGSLDGRARPCRGERRARALQGGGARLR